LESVVEKPSVVNNAVLEALVDRPLAVDKNAELLQQSQLEATGTLCLYKEYENVLDARWQ
jgi:hypothetical protein